MVRATSGQQKSITLSTTDAERYEVSKAVAVVLAERQFMGQIGVPQMDKTIIRTDNAADSSASDKQSLGQKRRQKLVQWAQEDGEVQVQHIKAHHNYADMLTKVLPHKLFHEFLPAMMRLHDAVAPAMNANDVTRGEEKHMLDARGRKIAIEGGAATL